MIRAVPITAIVALSMMSLLAQEPAFEVASVKVSANIDREESGSSTFRPGEVIIRRMALRSFLPDSFGVPPQLRAVTFDYSRVSRELLSSVYFDIHAKGNPAGDLNAMMQTLLRRRFGLKWHTEVRTLPVYTLTVKQPGRLGPSLKPSSINCRQLMKDGSTTVPTECRSPSGGSGPDGSTRQRSAGTIADLAIRLQNSSPLPIIDATGLKGNYAFDIAMPIRIPGRAEAHSVALQDAVESQLGLKLTQAMGPWKVIVIDDIRMPTPN